MKCLFIQSSAWLTVPHLFTSRTIRIMSKVMLLLVTCFTIIYTLVTTTQEEDKTTLVMGPCISLVLPSMMEMMWLAQWFSHSKRVREETFHIRGKGVITKIVTSYTIMIMLLVEISSMLLLLTMSGDREMFWAIFGLNCLNCLVLTTNPVLPLLFTRWEGAAQLIL